MVFCFKLIKHFIVINYRTYLFRMDERETDHTARYTDETAVIYRRNHSNRPAKRALMKALARHSFCKVPDDTAIIAAAIQRIQLLEHIRETQEEQIRTLILENLQRTQTNPEQQS